MVEEKGATWWIQEVNVTMKKKMKWYSVLEKYRSEDNIVKYKDTKQRKHKRYMSQI